MGYQKNGVCESGLPNFRQVTLLFISVHFCKKFCSFLHQSKASSRALLWCEVSVQYGAGTCQNMPEHSIFQPMAKSRDLKSYFIIFGYESKPWYPSEPQITGKWMFIPPNIARLVLIHPHLIIFVCKIQEFLFRGCYRCAGVCWSLDPDTGEQT
jgi:hypothetical protein